MAGGLVKGIDQFMWGFQPHFRMDLEHAANFALKTLGVAAAPMAVLIGFQQELGGHPICVEPEDVGIDPRAFDKCMSEGDKAYGQHDDRRFFNTDPGLDARFHAGLLDRCRTDAVKEALDAVVDYQHLCWFVGGSARVGRYLVYPAIGMIASTWNSHPVLAQRERDHRISMPTSLQESVVWEILASATFALSISDEPQELRFEDREELVRRGASLFLKNLVYFKGDFMGSDFGSAMNLVAAQPYEGRTGVGTMLMANKRDYRLTLAFETPVSLGQTRALRKALEMTDPRLHLITDGNVALGLGELLEDYDPASETAFSIRVIGRGTWELVHADVPLMTVTDGAATVPKERLARATFDDVVRRLFGDAGDIDRLWSLARAASDQAHGTMLVVHQDAEGEADRLSPPAMRVHPAPLTDATLPAVSAIDGAIIVDPSGECHAIGAILDGRATPGSGDASRGARYNSAHRYLAEAEVPCLIIIVSEDGMLNLIPELPRRVRRSYVENVLLAVESLSEQNPVNFEAFHKREYHLKSLSFYLSAEQCDRANEARERVERFRESSSVSHDGLGRITRVGYARLVPNDKMNPSFFFPEEDGLHDRGTTINDGRE